MTANDLVDILAERPFVPVRLCLMDGRQLVVRHPKLAMVTRRTVAVGEGGEAESLLADRIRICSVESVVQVETVG